MPDFSEWWWHTFHASSQQTQWFPVLDSPMSTRSWAQCRFYLAMLKRIKSREPNYTWFWRCQKTRKLPCFLLIRWIGALICELKTVLLTLTVLQHYYTVVWVDFCKHFQGHEYHYMECIQQKAHISSARCDDRPLRCLKKQYNFLHKIYKWLLRSFVSLTFHMRQNLLSRRRNNQKNEL